MKKQEFLSRLQSSLSGLPQEELKERLNFYSEIIDDKMEDGFSEDEAIEAIGSVEDIANQIISEIPLTKIAKERMKPQRRLTVLETILLVLGSPIWLSLGIAVLSVIFSLYAGLWSVIISFWAVFISFAATFIGLSIAGIIFSINHNIITGIAVFGMGLIFAGLSVLSFFFCKAITKLVVILTKKIAIRVKNLFLKKEKVL